MLVELCVLTAAYQEHRKAREDPKDKKKKRPCEVRAASKRAEMI